MLRAGSPSPAMISAWAPGRLGGMWKCMRRLGLLLDCRLRINYVGNCTDAHCVLPSHSNSRPYSTDRACPHELCSSVTGACTHSIVLRGAFLSFRVSRHIDCPVRGGRWRSLRLSVQDKIGWHLYPQAGCLFVHGECVDDTGKIGSAP